MFSKVRTNVVLLAILVATLTGVLAVMLIERMGVIIGNEILALLVGIGIGSLGTVMGQVAQDPPPPTVPAETHMAVVQRLTEEVPPQA